MKTKALHLFFISLIQLNACFIYDSKRILYQPKVSQIENTTNVKIIIGTSIFLATLYDNTAANALKKMIPFSIDMAELNGNEKYCNLKTALPAAAAPGGNIKAGDLMLYGDDVLVLFYKDFTTTYNYTKLGSIDNAAGLAEALGGSNAIVKFEPN